MAEERVEEKVEEKIAAIAEAKAEEKIEAIAEAVEEAMEETKCPYDVEECAEHNCDLCKADTFAREVATLVFGQPPGDTKVSELMVLAELDILVGNAKTYRHENTQLKAQLGRAGVEMDRLKAEVLQAKTSKVAGSELVVKASQALAGLQGAYGDDLTWDNIVERAGGALVRLQAQAPLIQAAEGELKRMRERLAQLESEPAAMPDPIGGVPPAPPVDARPPWAPQRGSKDDVSVRLSMLENDLQFFRVLGRVGSRLLGLDSLSRRM